MKRIFFLYMSVVFLLISCQDSSKSAKANEQVEDEILYLEFVNLDSTSVSINTIEQVKEELFNNAYFAGKEINSDWQGIRKLDADEQIKPQDIDQYHQYIHKFRDFAEYDVKDGAIEKIVITLNKPINDTIPNFNYRSYKKLGHADWQSVFNPGNFRYKESNTYTKDQLTPWMIKIIVLLTFK